MPEDPNVDMEAIKKDIKKVAEKYGTYRGSSEEKIAFGLKAVISSIVIPDAGGIVDDMEVDLREIEGIQSAEAIDITLI